MEIKKGVIAAAGRGTRFLPATKAVPKEMLPILDKPIIQYIVEEFVAAGIKDIIIVTGDGGHAIEEHFERSPELEEHLKFAGKKDLLEEMVRISEMANFIYVRQKGPYGNGTPCLSAKSAVGDEPFVYAYGDDLVLAEESFTKGMLESYEKNPGLYLGVQEISSKEVERYGIAIPLEDGKPQVKEVTEKPLPSETKSRLAMFGRFIMDPNIFDALEKTSLGKGGELWMTDAVNYLIKQGIKAYYKEVEKGRWHTTGDLGNYLRAVRAYALSQDRYKGLAGDLFVK
jgi:UTP--glucose-1-phosphate uridylyltransferase